jgi:methionyl-tRNA formyltransferase
MSQDRYETIVFCSNDIFSAIMLRGLLACAQFSVSKVYIEKERMEKQNNFSLFCKVVKKSGLRYAIYQAVELILYSCLMRLLSLLYQSALQTPRKQCEHQLIPCEEIDSTEFKDNSVNYEECDVLFCFRFSKILKERLLSFAQIATVNFHGSLLPKFAGLGSIFQAMRHQERQIGGSFHLMVKKIDGGDVIAQSSFPIDYDESVSHHHLKVYQESSNLFGSLGQNIMGSAPISNDSSEKEYFSFPNKSDLKNFHGSLINFRDIMFAFRIIKGGDVTEASSPRDDKL